MTSQECSVVIRYIQSVGLRVALEIEQVASLIPVLFSTPLKSYNLCSGIMQVTSQITPR